MKIIIFILVLIPLVWLISYLSYILSDRDKFRFRCYFYKDHYNKHLLRKEKGFTTHNKRIFNNNKNIISMSIYGNNPKYYNGLKERVREYGEILPDWKIRVYYHDLIDSEYKQYLESLSVELVEVTDPLVRPGNSSGMFWRFMPLSEHVTFIVVDVDNEPRFSRETLQHWIQSNNIILKQAPNPNIWPKAYIQAQAFGFKSDARFTPSEIKQFPLRSDFGSDELFIYFVVLEKYKNEEIMVYSKNIINRILHSFEMFIPVKKYKNISFNYYSSTIL